MKAIKKTGEPKTSPFHSAVAVLGAGLKLFNAVKQAIKLMQNNGFLIRIGISENC